MDPLKKGSVFMMENRNRFSKKGIGIYLEKPKPVFQETPTRKSPDRYMEVTGGPLACSGVKLRFPEGGCPDSFGAGCRFRATTRRGRLGSDRSDDMDILGPHMAVLFRSYAFDQKS